MTVITVGGDFSHTLIFNTHYGMQLRF